MRLEHQMDIDIKAYESTSSDWLAISPAISWLAVGWFYWRCGFPPVRWWLPRYWDFAGRGQRQWVKGLERLCYWLQCLIPKYSSADPIILLVLCCQPIPASFLDPLAQYSPWNYACRINSGLALFWVLAGFVGLTLYSTAFIAEELRAGISGVAKGQKYAAHALGLTGWQSMRYVVLPQALKIAMPPLLGQYMNIIKTLHWQWLLV